MGDELEAAVRAAHFELPMQSYRAIDVLGTFGYENGYTCINLTVNCNGDNRDALYMYSPTFVDLDQEMRVVERVYMDPETDTSPLVESILAPRMFHFRGVAAVAAM